jgi:sugar lactone lactonase YvrE
MPTLSKILLAFLVSLMSVAEALALRPMASSIALVAGHGGVPGYRDGKFTTAYFNQPFGLTISEDGLRLFVSDSDNNRIRLIQLDHNNDVSTLAGQGSEGDRDGSLREAQFNHPRAILYLPGDRLVVCDTGNKKLRLIDLKKGTVTTLAGSASATLSEGPANQVSMDGIRNLAYLPKADSLFLTQPEFLFNLKRLDMKTGKISVIALNQELPHPTSLCSDGEKLYVADRDQRNVFRLDWKSDSEKALVSVAQVQDTVTGLAMNGDRLYALHNNPEMPVERLLSQAGPVSFVSPFGDVTPPGYLPSIAIGPHGEFPICIVPDPLDLRKLYITNPQNQIVSSFRDLTGNQYAGFDGRNSNGVCEPEYPARKPPKTFRILLVGDSRTNLVAGYAFKQTWNTQPVGRTTPPPNQLTISKRMEMELNTLAALDDQPFNYEVFNLMHSAAVPLFLWPSYEVPEVIQKNDIDLVVIMHPPTVSSVFPFFFYFQRPLNADGIPLNTVDGEYAVKPASERIPNGIPRVFYDFCESHKLVKMDGTNFNFEQSVLKTPELREPLIQMYGKPLVLLKNKISKMKTSAGKPVALVLCSTHSGFVQSWPEEPEIWAAVCDRNKIKFLDLNEDMTAVQLSFHSLDENGSNQHFNQDGHLVFSAILAHGLIHSGALPWKN